MNIAIFNSKVVDVVMPSLSALKAKKLYSVFDSISFEDGKNYSVISLDGVWKVVDSAKLKEYKITDDLSQYENGYIIGNLAASKGDTLETALAENNEINDLDFIQGIKNGYYSFVPEDSSDEDEDVLNSDKSALEDSISIRVLKYKMTKSPKLKREILDFVDRYLDCRDKLNKISDAEYNLAEDDGKNQVAVKFNKDDAELKKYLEDNPDKKIIKTDGDDVYVASKEAENDLKTDIDIVDSVDPSLDGYSLNKVNQNHFEVLKNNEKRYDLEKKENNWTCTCTGFKYRGKCKHLALLKDVLPKRHPRKEIDDMVPEIQKIFEGFDKWEIVGSYRRKLDTFKDIDILVETTADKFRTIEERLKQDPNYKRTMSGPDILRGTYKGYDFDVTRVEPGFWVSYMLYRTGSADNNIKMRANAKKKGWRLNERGLFDENGNVMDLNSEEDYYKALGMKYLKPEER